MKLKVKYVMLLNLTLIGVSLFNSQPVRANSVDFEVIEHIPLETGYYEQQVWLGDLNDDGIVDIAVTSYLEWPSPYLGKYFLWVIFGLGDCTFSIRDAQAYYLGNSQRMHLRGICGADLDEDGYTDLAIADQLSDTILVILNRGDGTFESPVEFLANAEPMDICCADFDDDGDVDLATANYEYDPSIGDHGFSVLFNNGDATFETVGYSAGLAGGECAISVVARDFDMDGDIDLAVGYQFGPGGVGSWPSVVSLYLNNGDGSFKPWDSNYNGALDEMNKNIHDICSEDFDGDGDFDLAVANCWGGGGVSIGLNGVNNVDGTLQHPPFTHHSVISVERNPQNIFAGDFDYDGDIDLAITTDSHVSILVNDGKGTFSEDMRIDEGRSHYSVCGADFDNDADIDLVTVSRNTEAITVFKNRPGIWGWTEIAGIVVALAVVTVIIGIYAYYYYYHTNET